LENSSRLEPAAEAFANAVLHQQAAVSLSADAPRYNELLGKHQVNRQRVLKQLGRADEATGLSTL